MQQMPCYLFNIFENDNNVVFVVLRYAICSGNTRCQNKAVLKIKKHAVSRLKIEKKYAMSRLKIRKFAVSRFEIKKFAVCKGGGDIGLMNEFGTSTRRNHKMHSTSIPDINALMEHTHWNRHYYFTKYLVHKIYLQLYVLSTCKATDFLFYFLTVINFLCRKCTRAYHLKETTKMCCSTCILSNTVFQYCTCHVFQRTCTRYGSCAPTTSIRWTSPVRPSGVHWSTIRNAACWSTAKTSRYSGRICI